MFPPRTIFPALGGALRRILLVRKPGDPRTLRAAADMATWLRREHPDTQVLLELPATRMPPPPGVRTDADHAEPRPDGDAMRSLAQTCDMVSSAEVRELAKDIHLVVALGGDGTLLHVSSLFQGPVPPVASFSLGTLNFLPPFRIDEFPGVLNRAYDGAIRVSYRDRLVCHVVRDSPASLTSAATVREFVASRSKGGDGEPPVTAAQPLKLHVMNEVLVHRTPVPAMASIDCRVDGQLLTQAIADGLIIATPTGSTAYSLSAGGPLVHPEVPGILLTPICPRSLSFRPALFPQSSLISLQATSTGPRAPVSLDVSVDGELIGQVAPNDAVHIHGGGEPVPYISHVEGAGGADWVANINERLRWNQSFMEHGATSGATDPSSSW
ncbi:hypothetical protein AMAG_02771 [Allomyces macrogynus ATCC 38327]|uniref:ATP-NAD kinase n=1 Tax=Allomyces macrogynus (strain ATCC 38327) TaxID=578462 RepID=A0A0L0S3N2_ALLM3|nr:hypothetical protein AMAG_02771 [Allomyces macrogynus ATCC 38327]|eukprot:KNE57011.1 hypothetical protein AMAG_02771 [Allomyces macrogynus ATCC 38327]